MWHVFICRVYSVGMTILPRLAWPTPPCFALRGFFPPHEGDGAGMGRDFSPASRAKTEMDLDFLEPTRSIPHPPRIDKVKL